MANPQVSAEHAEALKEAQKMVDRYATHKPSEKAAWNLPGFRAARVLLATQAKLEEAEAWGNSAGAYTKQELERMYNRALTREVKLHAQLAAAEAKLGEIHEASKKRKRQWANRNRAKLRAYQQTPERKKYNQEYQRKLRAAMKGSKA